MRIFIALAIVGLLAGCVTTDQAQVARRDLRASKVKTTKQVAVSRPPVVLGLAY